MRKSDDLMAVEVHQLTNLPMDCVHAYYDVSPWSPDGQRIVFSCSSKKEKQSVNSGRAQLLAWQGEIWIMNADGGSSRNLCGDAYFYDMQCGAYPIWSVDSKEVYFLSSRDGVNIDAVNVETLERRPLTFFKGFDIVACLMLSPDGERLTFVGGKVPHVDLYFINVDCSNLRRFQGKAPITHPKWSRDGRWLAYVEGSRMLGNGELKRIWVMRPSGSDRRVLSVFHDHHVWSPDGRSVLFYGYANEKKRAERALFMIDVESGERRIVNSEGVGVHASFSPDGRWIVADVLRGGLFTSLVLISPETGRYIPLINLRSKAHPHPVWSSDGQCILFDSDELGYSQLYLLTFEEITTLPAYNANTAN